MTKQTEKTRLRLARIGIVTGLVIAISNFAVLVVHAVGWSLPVEVVAGWGVLVGTVSMSVRSWIDPTGAIGPKLDTKLEDPPQP